MVTSTKTGVSMCQVYSLKHARAGTPGGCSFPHNTAAYGYKHKDWSQYFPDCLASNAMAVASGGCNLSQETPAHDFKHVDKCLRDRRMLPSFNRGVCYGGVHCRLAAAQHVDAGCFHRGALRWQNLFQRVLTEQLAFLFAGASCRAADHGEEDGVQLEAPEESAPWRDRGSVACAYYEGLLLKPSGRGSSA
eukprot:1142382-Pelagomonas_calceolata.AAC.16